jgi:hypothetical protein
MRNITATVSVNGPRNEMSKRSRRRRELTEDEHSRILKETPVIFQERGVVNYERAVFARLVGEHVIGSSTPLFFCMQPKLKDRCSKAWTSAYSLVFAWLEEHAKETRETIRMEFAKSPSDAKEDFESIADEFDTLLRIDIDDFAARVAAYSAAQSIGAGHPVEDFNADSNDSAPSGTDLTAIDELNCDDDDVRPEPEASAESLGSMSLSFDSK